ncbi:MAG: YlmC/YmxH family sporulation protein [Limnochordales bacterium]|nr:YlmC/YmxH family sporulation protein [Limnochordales bacterium]
MRLSELTGKEIVASDEGIRLGTVAGAELLLSTDSGRVEALLIPQAPRRFWSGWFGRGGGSLSPSLTVVPWSAVEKIGPELVLVRLARARELPPQLRSLTGGWTG